MHTTQIGAVCVADRYVHVYSSLRIQLRLELYAEGMHDTYAYSSFEHISRNVVMKSSRLDYDRTLLLLASPDTNMTLSTILLSRVFKISEHC